MLPEEDISRLRRLMELRDKKDTAETAAKKAKAEYVEAEMELFEILNEGPISRLPNVDLGEPWGKVSFQKRETKYGRVIKGMEDEALKHYEQRAVLDQMTTREFAMKRLNEEVRDRLEQGLPMPPGVDFYSRRGVTITRQKGGG